MVSDLLKFWQINVSNVKTVQDRDIVEDYQEITCVLLTCTSTIDVGRSPIASFFKWHLLYGCSGFDKIAADIVCLHSPLASAELLVYYAVTSFF